MDNTNKRCCECLYFQRCSQNFETIDGKKLAGFHLCEINENERTLVIEKGKACIGFELNDQSE
jgi:hypothetical protein